MNLFNIIFLITLIASISSSLAIRLAPNAANEDSSLDAKIRFRRGILPVISDIRKKRNLPQTFDIRK